MLIFCRQINLNVVTSVILHMFCVCFKNCTAAVVLSFCSPSAVALFFGYFSLVFPIKALSRGSRLAPGRKLYGSPRLLRVASVDL